MFFGNVSTNGGSTYPSLLSADTNCELSADAAAYWSPTLYDGPPSAGVCFFADDTSISMTPAP